MLVQVQAVDLVSASSRVALVQRLLRQDNSGSFKHLRALAAMMVVWDECHAGHAAAPSTRTPTIDIDACVAVHRATSAARSHEHTSTSFGTTLYGDDSPDSDVVAAVQADAAAAPTPEWHEAWSVVLVQLARLNRAAPGSLDGFMGLAFLLMLRRAAPQLLTMAVSAVHPMC